MRVDKSSLLRLIVAIGRSNQRNLFLEDATRSLEQPFDFHAVRPGEIGEVVVLQRQIGSSHAPSAPVLLLQRLAERIADDDVCIADEITIIARPADHEGSQIP